jgi:formiminoglutamase
LRYHDDVDILKFLKPADKKLFFSRGDPDDPRLGDRVTAQYRKGTARFALVGVPDDRGVAHNGGRTGAAQAPDAIREELYRMTTGMQGGLEFPRLVDLGNLEPEETIERSHTRLTEVVRWILEEGMLPIVLGGGNDHAYATSSALHLHRGGDSAWGLINVDAHLDVRPATPGRINSGTPFRRLLEGPLRGQHFVEFAVQEERNARVHFEFASAQGVQIHSYEKLRSSEGPVPVFRKVISGLASRLDAIVFSLDIDACRAADAPGASAAGPLGLSADELCSLVELGGRCPKVALFELYEVNPLFDVDRRTCKLAAGLIYRFVQERLKSL